MSSQARASEISDMCDQYGCSGGTRKIHHDQFVYRRWNPHPSAKFLYWWGSEGAKDAEHRTGRAWVGIDAVRAYNCEAVQEIYTEVKEIGAA